MAINRIKTGGITDGTIQSGDIAPGTIASDRLAGSVANAKLANSTITINGTAVALGGSVTAGTDWQAITVADGSTQLTAQAGKGYFLDTNTGVIEVFLPASPSRGDTVVLADYGSNFATNNVIVNTGGELIDSVDPNFGGGGYTLSTDGLVVELVYADSNKGWLVQENEAKSSLTAQTDTNATYINATGGTVTTSGNFKIHTFTGDGCFVVGSVGNPAGSTTVDYLVVAGGGSSSSTPAGGVGLGGAGAGGLRFFASPDIACYPASPLKGPAALSVSETTYPITVGAGGTKPPAPSGSGNGTAGSNSIFSTITSTGGGVGANDGGGGGDGGSGGGNANNVSGGVGSGNTPPVSPPQGKDGGGGTASSPGWGGGGGGGALAVGADSGGSPGGDGGIGGGFPSAFVHTNGELHSGHYYFAGGGGAGSRTSPGGAGDGGKGGGKPGVSGGGATAQSGDANTGGGAGGSAGSGSPGGEGAGGNGGKGIVIIRYKFQSG